MKNPFKRNRGKSEVALAIGKLTNTLCDIEKSRQEANKELKSLLDDPQRLGEVIRQAMEVALPPPTRVQVGLAGGPPSLTTEVEVRQLPSPENIKEAMETVTKAVLEKMEDMQKHIAEAVSELPPNLLERIAEKVKAGEEFKLRRRHGCVHIDFGEGDDEFYLRL